MDRKQLKSRPIAGRGYGNACFLDEGDEARADAVVFTPYEGAWMVYATDEAAAPVEATRRSFATDVEAFDYMYACLREKVAGRHTEVRARVEDAAAEEARRGDPEQMVYRTLRLADSYREMGVVRTLTTIASVLTAVGWIAVAPFTYTRDDTRAFGVDDDQRGSFIFGAETGLMIVAVCYSIAVVNVLAQWWMSRRGDERVRRRALRTAGATALFSTVTLVCMLIRAGEVDNPLYWIPPVAALLSATAAAVSLLARRQVATEAPSAG